MNAGPGAATSPVTSAAASARYGASALEPPDRALLDAARSLIALATRLRHSAPPQPQATLLALAGEIARFERVAAAAHAEPRAIAAASYVLCVWVDEAVADTPWGGGAESLLERYHGERDGSVKVLQLLSRLAEQPRENRALLELFHACLSLGLHGALRLQADAARQLEMLRKRVFLAWPHTPLSLSAPIASAVPPGPSPLKRRLAWGLVPLFGLIAFAVYSTSHLLLARRVDEVFASMQHLSSSGPAPASAVASAGGSGSAGTLMAARAQPPLAPLLADDAAAGRLSVRDEATRSVVTIPAQVLFEPNATRPGAPGSALLGRVAAGIEKVSKGTGKVLVVGHTDGRDVRTARLPSAWHQSSEWAGAAQEVLGHVLPPERLSAEGAGDTEPAGASALPARRVDIIWYP